MIVTIKKAVNKHRQKKVSKKWVAHNQTPAGKGNIAQFFGANPHEKDGLEYQQKVRSEWD